VGGETQGERETPAVAVLEPSTVSRVVELKAHWQVVLRPTIEALNFELVIDPSLHILLRERYRWLECFRGGRERENSKLD